MIKEFTDSFNARLHDSIVTPFFGSFIISWLIYNHEYVLVYFADYNLELKIHYLDELYPIMKTNSIGAFVTAFFYLTIYPYIANIFLYISLKHKKMLKDTKIEGEGKISITPEEKSEIYHVQNKLKLENEKIIEQLAKYEKNTEELNKDVSLREEKIINEFKKQISEIEDSNHNYASALENERNSFRDEVIRLKEEFDNYKERNSKGYDRESILLKFDYTKDEVDFLRFLYDWTYETQNIRDFKNNVMSTMSMSMIVVNSLIKKFSKDKIIEIVPDEHFEEMMSIKEKGEDLLKLMFSDTDG